MLNNWCLHAEIDRSPGRGLIEEQTGLPIGHMGVKCKFSKKDMIQCWLFEDAIYDFYLNNCKNCQQRASVGLPNIMSFIIPREKEVARRKKINEESTKIENQKRAERKAKRDVLRQELSLIESHVFDLIDELDNPNTDQNDVRLEHLANLAPETFTRKIIKLLLPDVLQERLSYSIPVAKALIKASLQPKEMLSVAVWLLQANVESEEANNIVLSSADELSETDLDIVLSSFVFMALGYAPPMNLGQYKVKHNYIPIRSLYKKLQAKIDLKVNEFIRKTDSNKVKFAVKIILATESEVLLMNNISIILTKLMYRNVLYADEGEESSLLYYLRQVASKCFRQYPEDTDSSIQQLIGNNKEIASDEASRIYNSVFMHGFNEKLKIGVPQKIAFRRLLWIAMENPDKYKNEARSFWGNVSTEYAELATDLFQELIGAAAILSDKYEKVDLETPLEVLPIGIAQMNLSNKRAAIYNLQESLLEWAAIGVKSKGREGLADFLVIFRKLPETDILMRGNMIFHVSKLLTGVNSINQVIQDWYGALMDKENFVRARAVDAWRNVPYHLVENFPDLFYEAISITLVDPYVSVHKSAIKALRHRFFPKDKYYLVSGKIFNLICCYAQEKSQDNFIIDCIDLYTGFCLAQEQLEGEAGRIFSNVLLKLEGYPLYDAISRFYYSFINVPDFIKVALKSIQDNYTRSLSIDNCKFVILKSPKNELKNCIDEIVKAFNCLYPLRPDNFEEALIYIYTLSRLGENSIIITCLRKLLSSIPSEIRYDQIRYEVSLVILASEIEQAISLGTDLAAQHEEWNKLILQLEKEYDEQVRFQDVLPSFLSEARDC